MQLSKGSYKFIVEFIAFTLGFLHRDHVAMLFENDRHFSHLSEIEREMSFRTEMGMYYYYYKLIVEAPTWSDGLKIICNDTHSQYPSKINALKTYNLIPEIVAGFLYHKAKYYDLLGTPVCWQIERGEELPAVKSCQGLSVPSYFYIEFVWWFAAMTGAMIFLYATYLSDSIFGGFIAWLGFIFNHTECTRIQWSPPLRESFGYPILLWQMYTVATALDDNRNNKNNSNDNVNNTSKKCDKIHPNNDNNTKIKKIKWIDYFTNFPIMRILVPTVLCLACWQFSQFVLATQIIAILILCWMKIISRVLTLQLTAIHVLSIGINGIIVGNYDSLSTIYAALVIGIIYSNNLLISLFKDRLSKRMLVIVDIILTIGFTYLHQTIMMRMTSEDYNHIFDILKAKLTNYKDFHTLLYTCAAEFDFLPYESYEVIIKTLLLPTAILAGFFASYYWYRNYKILNYPHCIEPGMAYTALQTGAFIIMAAMIMRLKLFMNPHLCIISGCVASKRYLEKLGIKSERYFLRELLLIILIAAMCYHGCSRVQEEYKHYGEFSNIEQEELFEWIKRHTPANAVFAGRISVMANLLLSTRRPIVNNPYYESKEMRDRTLKVYEIYSRNKDVSTVYETLKNMHVDYLIIEEVLCYGFDNRKIGCRIIDLWDITSDSIVSEEDGKDEKIRNRRQPVPLCQILYEGNSHPFKRVFMNNHYLVLSLDYSTCVEIKPKVTLLQS